MRDPIVCDVSALTHPDVGTLDALAWLALTCRRLGRPVRLRQPPTRLWELLELAGLCDVLPIDDRLSLEPGRQAEEREEAGRVEEEGDPGNPVA